MGNLGGIIVLIAIIALGFAMCSGDGPSKRCLEWDTNGFAGPHRDADCERWEWR